MELELFFLDGYKYLAKERRMPIIARIGSGEKIKIKDKIDLCEILLKNPNGQIVAGYYRACTLSRINEDIEISLRNPFYLFYDLLSKHEDGDEILLGKYEVTLKLMVYKANHGKYETIELNTSRCIVLN